MKFLLFFNSSRAWTFVYGFAAVAVLVQFFQIFFYSESVGRKLEAKIAAFKEEAASSFSRGDFDLEGFSGPAYLYQNNELRRWNNSDYLPPTFFIQGDDSLAYVESQKKYLVLFKVSQVKEGNRMDLVFLTPLFQESPRDNPIIQDVLNKDLFSWGGIGPDSFEGNSNRIRIYGSDLIFYSIDYSRLKPPMVWRIIDTILILLIWIGVFGRKKRETSNSISEVFKWGIYFFLFASAMLFLWLGFLSHILLISVFTAVSAVFLDRLLKGENVWIQLNISRFQFGAIFLFLVFFFSIFLNNWVEVNQSSYLGLNVGLSSQSLIRYLIFSTGLIAYALSLGQLLQKELRFFPYMYLGIGTLLGSMGAWLLLDGLFWAWLLPVGFFLFVIHFISLSRNVALGFLLLGLTTTSALVTRDISLSQRLSQFEEIIRSINRPEDTRMQEDLGSLKKEIARDPLVISSFKRTMGTFNSVEKKILGYHLKDFKGYYDFQLSFFDHLGRNLQPDKSTTDLAFYKNQYFSGSPRLTENSQKVINNAMGHVQEFFILIDVIAGGSNVGSIFLHGERREGFSGGVGPVVNSLEGLNFNYSYWPYSSFKVSKEKGLLWDDWVESESLKGELADSIYSHFDMMGSLAFDKEGLFLRAVVFDHIGYGLAFPFPGFLSVFGNVLILLLAALGLFLAVLVLQFISNRPPKIVWNLRTKMQVLYLMAIIIPLGIFSFVLFLTQTNSFEENLQAKDVLKAKNFYNLTKANFNSFLGGDISRTDFIEKTKLQAEEDGLNISVYDQSGTMFYTDFPSLYRSHLFSSLIDPNIYFDQRGLDINYRKVRKSKVVFGTVIFPLTASNGDPYYYLFVPFFDNYKKVERERERMAVITIGLFGLFSSLFVFIAFFFTKEWLQPLDLLSGQLKKVRLTEDPKPIEWKQEDEIGEVVGAYNLMISKLIESREALSISKQDEAWKEMAKQVAHEIKNPLTPMRLRIQQVLSQLSKDKVGNKDLIRYLEDALRNIDLVNEIAKSFQGFASLPEPKNRDIDLQQLLKQVISPFSAHPQADLKIETYGKEFGYFADPKILGGAFLNLVLNGLQSVPESRKPLLRVKIESNEDGSHQIYFEDNGPGVDEDMKEKIFEAHYTTKKSGSGLGLQIVKRSIEVYKGEIKIDRSKLGGARFMVSLPPQE